MPNFTGHCHAEPNDCRGIMDCFCTCERCIQADELAGSDEPDYGGAFDGNRVISDADPGL